MRPKSERTMDMAKRLLMSELKIPRKLQKEVSEKVRAAECLTCGEKVNSDGARGCCAACYAKFYAELQKRGDKESQLVFETACVRSGLILPAYEKARIASNNPFKDVG